MPPIEQLHPIAVHFPIVFVLSLAVFDIAAVMRGAHIGGRGAVANVSTGIATLAGLGALVAYIFGDIAFDIAKAVGSHAAQLELHEEFGTFTAGVVVVWSIIRLATWWRLVPLGSGRAAAVMTAEIAIAVLVITTAYFGGSLVYEYGVGVARLTGS